MNANPIRVELEAVKVALREGRADTADLQARTHRASSSLVVLIGQRWRPMTPLEEHDLWELVALGAEINAVLEAHGGVRGEQLRLQRLLYGTAGAEILAAVDDYCEVSAAGLTYSEVLISFLVRT